MALSRKEMHRRGYKDDDIELASKVSSNEHRLGFAPDGGPPRSVGQILGKHGTRRRKTDPVDLTPRQLRKHGRLGAAALLADQEALTGSDAVRQLEIRMTANKLKELAEQPEKPEFDFFKGNWSVAEEYHDTIRDRIHALPLTPAKRAMAIMVMAEIIRWLPWEGSACTKTAAEIQDLLKIRQADVSCAIKTLEQIGAVHRVTKGRTKLIYVNPEGAYRGNVNKHVEAVDRYKAEVFDLQAEREKRP